MHIEPTEIPDVLLLTPQLHHDDRGYFYESFNQRHFPGRTWTQDNESFSHLGVLRGLHYQVCTPQAKIVRVIQGEILDVAVDIRVSSPTFRQHVARVLSSDNHQQLFIPEGFAHGFIVRSHTAQVAYKASSPWSAGDDRSIRWDDAELCISWGVGAPRVSLKDAQAPSLQHAELFQ